MRSRLLIQAQLEKEVPCYHGEDTTSGQPEGLNREVKQGEAQ